jgi:lysophospholipase L1-like esterase
MTIRFVVSWLIAGTAVYAGRTVQTPVPAFETGDRVAFVGDSITHGGSYHADIYLFYATRFPDRPFTPYNCGVAGDTAVKAIARFEDDIAVHHPTVSTVMLGMNDVNASLYGKTPPSAEELAAREAAFGEYRKSMEELASLLRNSGSRIIFLTPSIYDQTARIDSDNHFGRNDGLGRFAGFVKDLAAEYHSPFVDLYTLMKSVNLRIQQDDPAATVIGPDRTHPLEPGHLLMAYAVLRAQRMPEYVSSIGIDAGSGDIVEAINCEVGPVHCRDPQQIDFTCRGHALPFPVSEAQQPALEWVPFQQDLNREMLTVRNLPEGTYRLLIDDQPVAVFSATELGRGINLADHSNTPQYRQALEVKKINDARRALAGQLRSVAYARHNFLGGQKRLPDDDEALREMLYGAIEKHREQSWYGYMKKECDRFIELHDSEERIGRQIEALCEQMYRINHPVERQWKIIGLEE